MSDELIPISCDKCQARFRIKPNVFKIMKTLRCTKCGHNIVLAKFAEAARTTTEPQAPAPVAASVTPAPAPAMETPASATSEPAKPVAAPPPPAPVAIDPVPSLKEEIESLRAKIRILETDLAEADTRVADLQKLWQGKELEVREMADRMNKAEASAKQAIALRDAFLARVKHELAIHLVKERDASMSRFAEFEHKLLEIKPERD